MLPIIIAVGALVGSVCTASGAVGGAVAHLGARHWLHKKGYKYGKGPLSATSEEGGLLIHKDDGSELGKELAKLSLVCHDQLGQYIGKRVHTTLDEEQMLVKLMKPTKFLLRDRAEVMTAMLEQLEGDDNMGVLLELREVDAGINHRLKACVEPIALFLESLRPRMQ
jgi:hypothetical protein